MRPKSSAFPIRRATSRSWSIFLRAGARAEHGDITWLAETHPGQVYGLAYKDAPEATRAFLAELGNPFETIGVDRSGQGGLDFGLTGVPETFVISPDGQIILHVRGPLDAERREEVSEALSG